MKKILIALCMALCLPAFAQSVNGTATQATQQRQDAVATSAVGGVTGSNNFTIESSPIPTATSALVTQHVETSGTTTIRNTPSLGGTQLTTSNDTCMGSTSAGGAAPGIALQFGTTWADNDCKRLKVSREMWNKGYRATSLAIDCTDPMVREGMKLTMEKCPQDMTEQERYEAYVLPREKAMAAAKVSAIAAPVAAPVAPVAMATPAAPAQVMASGNSIVTRDAKGNEFIDMRTR